MAVFPSIEWFDEVREVFNTHPEYHGAGGGACETTFGVRVGQRMFRLTMEGLECISADEIGEQQHETLDFYLDLEPDEWQEMLENIRDHGGADLDHSLNTLDLELDEGLARSTGDQYRQDLFFRYNQTLQHFFDASARIRTEF